MISVDTDTIITPTTSRSVEIEIPTLKQITTKIKNFIAPSDEELGGDEAIGKIYSFTYVFFFHSYKSRSQNTNCVSH